MKLVIIANPVAGGGSAFKSIQSFAGQKVGPGWDVEILPTRGPRQAGSLARELLEDPPDLVGICGGDGTVNEVVSSVPAPPFPVAILPAGTANVVARELGIPLNPVRALRMALNRTVRRVDVGELGDAAQRFLFVAGIGFDAYVAAAVRPELKKRLGMAAYAVAIVECLRNYRFPEFRVVAGDREYKATSCLACNARSYGGGLLFCPDADMSDGLLDILVLEGRQRLGLARFLLKAWLGKPESGPGIHRFRSRTLRIEGNAGVFVQADGELAGRLPLDIGIRDKSFPLVIP